MIFQKESSGKIIKTPNIESRQKLLLITRERAQYGDIKVYEMFERSKNLRGDDSVKYKTCCHKKCYSEFTNIALEQGKSTVVKRKAGHPSTNTLETEIEVKKLRSQSIKYDKDLSIICQKISGSTHNGKTLETGKLMHSSANKIKNKDFFLRLNPVLNPGDGVQMMYVIIYLVGQELKKKHSQ